MKLGKEFKVSFVLVSVCYLVLGLVLLFYPSFSQRMLCYALGGITVVYGLVHLVTYFARTEFEETYRLDFVSGVVMTLLGVYVIAQPIMVMTLLHIILGCAILLDSLIKLQTALDLHRLGSRIWVSVLVMSLVTGGLGLVLLLSDTYAMFTLTQFIGLCLVVDGCVNVWSILFLSLNLNRLRKERREAQQAQEQQAQAEQEAMEEEPMTAAQQDEATPDIVASHAAQDVAACAKDEPEAVAQPPEDVPQNEPLALEQGDGASAENACVHEEALCPPICETREESAQAPQNVPEAGEGKLRGLWKKMFGSNEEQNGQEAAQPTGQTPDALAPAREKKTEAPQEPEAFKTK